MRISLNWLKDYLDIKPETDIDQISESLTLAGLEVEAVEHIYEKASRLLLGCIVGVHHENESRVIYKVLAQETNLKVQGPQGIPLDSIVAYEPSAQTADIDGIIANFTHIGFLENEPILFEASAFEVMPEHLGLVKDFDDVIITLGITPNRADALSHLGISRELSALLDSNPKAPMLTPKEMAGPTHEKVAIEIEDSEECPRYACRIIENVKVQKSPLWLRFRLMACGIRPINNVVDVTNFVMLSRGQPMHAFDFAALNRENGRAKIMVRRALDTEELVVLDGKKLKLSTQDLVIADSSNVVALAGVMGGKDSAINEGTTTVFLESAYFNSTLVRLSARRHGIVSESSYRFERGVDPNGVVDALNYAARLLSEVADGKVCREPIDAYRKRIDALELKMRPERAQAVLGMTTSNFDQDLLRKRFLRLGIETIAKRGDAIYFRVPTYRSDLTREIDLIEEAARMLGYDKIGDACVGLDSGSDTFADKKSEAVVNKLRHTLVGRGFLEAINYAFLPKEFHSYFLPRDVHPLEIKNPLSERYGVLRQSLVPGLIKNLAHNQNNQEKSIQLFEIGSVFLGHRREGEKPHPDQLFGSLDQDSFCIERQALSGLIAGRVPYYAFDHQPRVFDFFHLKGMLEDAFRNLGLKSQFPHKEIYFEHGADVSYLHPGESVTITYKEQGKTLVFGHGGKIHPDVALRADVSSDVYVFELTLKDIVQAVSTMPAYRAFSRYPIIERDVAFLVDEEVRVGDLLDIAQGLDGARDMLANMRVFDIYRGKNIGLGKKSVAISLSLQCSERTLTDEDAEAFVGQFITLAQEKTGATLR